MGKNSHFFYVLYCNDNTLYGGYTNNLLARVEKHQSGKGAKYTRVKKRHPLQLLYAEEWSTKQAAMAQEYGFKQLTRQQKEAYLFNHGVKKLTQNEVVMIDQKE